MRKKPISINQAIRGFVGSLERNGLAHHTLRSYKSDLRSFERHCAELSKELSQIDAVLLKDYRARLVRLKHKKNTFRRKILTLQQFLEFLVASKYLKLQLPVNLSIPAKILRTPHILSLGDIQNRLKELKVDRSSLLVWIALETGLRTSELIRVRREDFDFDKRVLRVTGKIFRIVEVSSELCAAVSVLKTGFLFAGFNRFGPVSERMTERGAEMTIKAFGKKLGAETLTARSIRHSLVDEWLRGGMSKKEILQRLGLRTESLFLRFKSG